MVSLPLPRHPFNTVIKEFELKFTDVKLQYLSNANSYSYEESNTNFVQQVNLTGKKSSVEKCLAQITETMNKLTVEVV